MGAPRRIPRQARARATVAAILEATHRILEEEGPDALTTNRVAAVAGVSIGSLYQYFPDKSALLGALFARHTEGILVSVPSLIHELRDAPLDVVTRRVVQVLLEAHRHNPRLHEAMMRRTTQDAGLERSRRAEGVIRDALMQFFADRAPELRDLDREVASFVISRSVQALAQQAARDHPDWMDDGRLVDELTALLVGYVRRRSQSP